MHVGANLGQGFVDGGRGDRAGRNVDQLVPSARSQKSDFGDAALTRPLKVGCDLGAVAPFLGRSNDGFDGTLSGVDPCEVLEQLGDLALFPEELFGIGKVLVLTAAAFSKQATASLNAVRGGLENFQQVRFRVGLVVAKHSSANPFPGQREGHEHHPAINASQALAEIGQGVDREFDFLVVLEGIRIESLRRTGSVFGVRWRHASAR